MQTVTRLGAPGSLAPLTSNLEGWRVIEGSPSRWALETPS